MTTVCFVLESHVDALLGGAEYQAHLLATEISSRKDTNVYYLARAVPAPEVAAKLPYEIVPIGNRHGLFHKRGVFLDARSLWRELDAIKPDVIYQRMKQSYTGICASYANRTRTPLFFHAANDIDLQRELRQRSVVNLPFDFVESVIGNWGVKHATQVLVQTERQRQLLRENYDRDARALVPNFQPLPSELPTKSGGPIRVLWVANILEHKRPELFSELAAAFAHRPDIQFIMVGRPSQAKKMRAIIQTIQNQPNVQYLGGLPLEEVERVMADAHIFVNTSSFEGFPNTFIQAWARGTVVVTINVDIDGGMDVNGIGFCTRNFKTLQLVVDRLARSADERHAVADKAFRYVHERHSLKSAAKLADLILAAAGG